MLYLYINIVEIGPAKMTRKKSPISILLTQKYYMNIELQTLNMSFSFKRTLMLITRLYATVRYNPLTLKTLSTDVQDGAVC